MLSRPPRSPRTAHWHNLLQITEITLRVCEIRGGESAALARPRLVCFFETDRDGPYNRDTLHDNAPPAGVSLGEGARCNLVSLRSLLNLPHNSSNYYYYVQ